jgi:hypothetical protein
MTPAASQVIALGNCTVAGGSGTTLFNGPVQLIQSTALVSGSGTVQFGSTIDGGYGLSVSGGSILFSGAIGGTNRLGSLTIPSSTSATFSQTAHLIGAASLTSSAISLNGDFTSQSGALSFNGPVALQSSLQISTIAGSTSGANITFGGTLNANSPGGQSLQVYAGTGEIISNSTIGQSASLNDLNVFSDLDWKVYGQVEAAEINVHAPLLLNGSIIFKAVGP